MAEATRGGSQRERLRGRQRPRTTYQLVMDGDAIPAARAALTAALQEQRRARLTAGKGRAAALRRADAAVAEAQARLEACYETIVLQAVEPKELERLMAEHPPTPEQMAAARKRAEERGEPPDWPAWNEDTFRPALLAACAVESDMTEEDWAEFLRSNVSNGEKVGLWQAVIAVNHRERVADPLVVPKELMAMISSR